MNSGVTYFILKYRWQINYGMNNQACVLSYAANRPLSMRLHANGKRGYPSRYSDSLRAGPFGFEPRLGWNFPHKGRPTLGGPHSVLYTWLRDSFAGFKTHSHLAQRLSLRKAISVRPVFPVVRYGMTFTFTLIQVHNASLWENVNLYLTLFCTRIMHSERIFSVSLPQIILRTPFAE